MSAAERNELESDEVAFPRAPKELLVGASHLRNAIARFER
jgi:hypothetical protein